MEIEEILDESIDEIIDVHLRTIRDEIERMQEIREELFGIITKIEAITESRDDLAELGRLMRLYDDTRNEEELINYHELYLAGIKDGVKLLKSIGVIETAL